MTRRRGAGELALRQLQQADALLARTLRGLLHASSELPQACHPLRELLDLSELQALRTLDAVDAAQAELQELRDSADWKGRDDAGLQRLEAHLQTIRSAQQSQDLAGQRLKRTIAILQAVEPRIREALAQWDQACLVAPQRGDASPERGPAQPLPPGTEA